MTKLLSISGGGTKIVGLYACAKLALTKGKFQPDIIAGISSGAILTLPLALGKFSELDQKLNKIRLDDFFSVKPVNEKGKLTLQAVWNAISGKHYLGKMGNLKNTLSQIITEEDYFTYQTSDYAEVIIGTVDMMTGAKIFIHLKRDHISYEDYLKLVCASASIPLSTEGEKYKNYYLFDGGLRDHSPAAFVLKDLEDVSHCLSIYSRPKDSKLKENFNPDQKNIFQMLSRTIDIMNVEISKNDELLEDKLCKVKNIEQLKIFLPSLTNNVYDINANRLEQLKVGSEFMMENIIKNEAFFKS